MTYDRNTGARWRKEAGHDNPAGPLFASGDFAAADIACEANELTLVCTAHCGTDCSGSGNVQCC
ncbi:MAG TPA: DUF6229 family protein [Rhizomicrobium sp.]|jgi:hypothetical protein|nr:DUF6229 family protein [Rhizomicrobium sp.]